ncbi:hypothetical protein JGG67_23015, partial [Salmonella enterica subsp. enterica serovar Derby]|nr:hypothetical protein [Salmonella enterica subsp. enterica serovar Derby]
CKTEAADKTGTLWEHGRCAVPLAVDKKYPLQIVILDVAAGNERNVNAPILCPRR